MTRWYHGGSLIRGDRLDPQPDNLTRSGESDGWVYITTSRSLAATYASTCEGQAFVHEVRPDHDPEPDPGSMLTYSFRCTGGSILKRLSISNSERALRSSTVLGTS